jgi:hypothetical protein
MTEPSMSDEEYFERLLVAAIEVEPKPTDAGPFPFTDLVTAAKHRDCVFNRSAVTGRAA